MPELDTEKLFELLREVSEQSRREGAEDGWTTAEFAEKIRAVDSSCSPYRARRVINDAIDAGLLVTDKGLRESRWGGMYRANLVRFPDEAERAEGTGTSQ